MIESKTELRRLSGDKVEARVNSPANVTYTERDAVTITTLFPAIMMMIFQYTAVLKQKPVY